MNFLHNWLASYSKWPKRDAKHTSDLYPAVFNTAEGRELLTLWMEEILLSSLANPFDSNQCIAQNARIQFVKDIIVAIDMAEHPDRYPQNQPAQRAMPRILGGRA